MPAIDLTSLDAAELERLANAAATELNKRRELANIRAQIENALNNYRATLDREDSAPWRAPTGPWDTYPAGAVVTHDGHTWTNGRDWNMREPGKARSGWTKQPSGEDGAES